MCTDWMAEEGGVFKELNLWNAFCAWDDNVCYTSKGASSEQRGVQTNPGRITTVNEYGAMSAGTSTGYTKGQTCVWHLIGATQYHFKSEIELDLK